MLVFGVRLDLDVEFNPPIKAAKVILRPEMRVRPTFQIKRIHPHFHINIAHILKIHGRYIKHLPNHYSKDNIRIRPRSDAKLFFV